MSSDGINLIGNKLLIDELDSDQDEFQIQGDNLMESINQYTEEGNETFD